VNNIFIPQHINGAVFAYKAKAYMFNLDEDQNMLFFDAITDKYIDDAELSTALLMELIKQSDK